MQIRDLDYPLPPELIAQTPKKNSRILFYEAEVGSREIDRTALLNLFSAGDVLVINESKVLKRRLFHEAKEILFLQKIAETERWEVLFPAKSMTVGENFALPENRRGTLISKGRPQVLEVDPPIDEKYFERHAELALPPYIQEARAERRPRAEDTTWYQTAWARAPGSLAAPTASLHLTNDDIGKLEHRGVKIEKIILHVGLGTFLPVKTSDLRDHPMHAEDTRVMAKAWENIQRAKLDGKKIFALGTTAARTLESLALGLIPQTADGDHCGSTKLFIYPPFEFRVVDVLLTNFHQPRSTLLGLVAAFAGLENVQKLYRAAIEKKFRFLSYGDLTVWKK